MSRMDQTRRAASTLTSGQPVIGTVLTISSPGATRGLVIRAGQVECCPSPIKEVI